MYVVNMKNVRQILAISLYLNRCCSLSMLTGFSGTLNAQHAYEIITIIVCICIQVYVRVFALGGMQWKIWFLLSEKQLNVNF